MCIIYNYVYYALTYIYVVLCVILVTNSLAWTAIFKVQYVACDETQTFIFDRYQKKKKLKAQVVGSRWARAG